MPQNTRKIVEVTMLLALQVSSTLGTMMWLPKLLWERNVNPAHAATLISLSLLAALVTLLGPGRRVSATASVVSVCIGFAGTVLLPMPASAAAAVSMGVGQGAAVARAVWEIRRLLPHAPATSASRGHGIRAA